MKKSRSRHCGPDKDYGPNATQPDLSETDPSNYEQYKEAHHEKLRNRQKNRTTLETETRNHPFSEPHGYEKDMIPSHLFGKICGMRETTSCSSVINDICNPFLFHEDVLLTMEDQRLKALQLLETQIGKKIVPCGIVVSHNAETFYLCARPDGLVDNDSIVIIVSVSDDEQTNINAALHSHKDMKNLFAKTASNKINTKHPIFSIIQGQLYVTNKQFCYFAVYTPNDLKIAEIIHKDDNFWLEKMKMKLHRFYYSALIDGIVDSRLSRSLPIREAPFTIAARAKKNLAETNKDTPIAQQSSSASTVPVDASTNDHDEELINDYRTVVLNRPLEQFKNNILNEDSLLDDLTISRFLLMIENRNFTIDLPITAANPLQQSTSDNDLAIIGGQADNQHWCCIHYDGHQVAIYDSLNRNNLNLLREPEKRYLQVRYPQQYKRKEIFFKVVTRQPDGSTCGVYAAAYATTIALDGNPCTINYSKDAAAMRKHLFQIISQNQLVQFPRMS
ncbi:Protein of unknown function [Cotesia congregata]|uniref:Ubiquitin-like protease family profile domain-containing protein n=1 Tax=Cotesia congregata TaxID=51543 RepID=A0A8J2HC21_COTCN|nr:Protein of unknown function [Cotesia congregata]